MQQVNKIGLMGAAIYTLILMLPAAGVAATANSACPTNGDYNRNGSIDSADYNRWRQDFLNGNTPLACYEYWRRAAFTFNQPSISPSPPSLSPTSAPNLTPVPTLTSPPSPPSAQFTLCQDSAWETTSGDNWVNYRCAKTCPSSAWRQCLRDSAEGSDAEGQPLKKLAFVVDGIGGELRFNRSAITQETPKGGLFIMPGGGGTDLNQLLKLTSMRYPLEQAGVLVVYATYQEGFIADGRATGWFSHNKPEQQSDFVAKTKRPAQTITWVRNHLLPTNAPFGTLGCSGGGLATFSSVYWHNLDSQIDLQIVGGGPPAAWDPNAACSGTPQNGEPAGICVEKPAQSCASAADCSGAKGCALSVPATGPQGAEIVRQVKELIDYVYGVENICAAGKTDSRFNSSAYRLTAGDWEYDHPVVFVIDAGQLPLSDKALTTAYFAGRTFTQIHTTAAAGKQWLVHNGIHCSWAYDPLFVNEQLIPRILSALHVAP